MMVRGDGKPVERDFQCGGGAAATAPVLLLPGPMIGTSDSTGSCEDLTRSTVQRTAQFIQDVRTIHSGAIVVQPEQSRVGHAGFLSQSINRPTPLIKDFSELTDNHAVNLADPVNLCQTDHIYELCFTDYKCRSRVAPRIRGAPSMQWKSTAISLRTGVSRTFRGLRPSADGVRT